MAFKENFDAFLPTYDFGEELRWGTTVFAAIFDNETYKVDGGEAQVPVDIQEPVFVTKDSAIDGLSQDDEIVRLSTGVRYLVKGMSPDGTGMTQVKLSRVS